MFCLGHLTKEEQTAFAAVIILGVFKRLNSAIFERTLSTVSRRGDQLCIGLVKYMQH